MKIEVDDNIVDLIVKNWLEETVELSKGTWTDAEDTEFWEEFGPLCERILELNFKWCR